MPLKQWIYRLSVLLLSALLMTQAPVSAAPLQKVATAWMGEQEAFPIWYAKEQGWDREAGLDVSMLYFNSGMDAVNTLPAGSWVYAGVGSVPALLGALRYDMSVIAICNDEARANAVLVRPDSPIARAKGYNNECPNVLGSPETVKGITVLTTTISSSHYALSTWLAALGLTEKDVTIKNMEQASALAAFDCGIGDAVVLWAPLTYVGQNRGWLVASTPHRTGHPLPLVLAANKTYAEKHPDITTKFLQIYQRGVEYMRNTPMDKLVEEYLRFYTDWAGAEYTAELAKRDLAAHNTYTLTDLEAAFDTNNGPSRVQQWFTHLAEFLEHSGRITRQELNKIHASGYITNKYIGLAAEEARAGKAQ